MHPKAGRRRRVVVGAVLLLAVVSGSMALWARAAPPSPKRILAALQVEHGIELDREGRDIAWDYDRIANEWAWLSMARSSLPSGTTPKSVVVGGWKCSIQLAGDADVGVMLLGSGTIAAASGSTLTKRMPDGTFQCETTSRIEEGPATYLLVAAPIGAVERIRYGIP